MLGASRGAPRARAPSSPRSPSSRAALTPSSCSLRVALAGLPRRCPCSPPFPARRSLCPRSRPLLSFSFSSAVSSAPLLACRPLGARAVVCRPRRAGGAAAVRCRARLCASFRRLLAAGRCLGRAPLPGVAASVPFCAAVRFAPAVSFFLLVLWPSPSFFSLLFFFFLSLLSLSLLFSFFLLSFGGRPPASARRVSAQTTAADRSSGGRFAAFFFFSSFFLLFLFFFSSHLSLFLLSPRVLLGRADTARHRVRVAVYSPPSLGCRLRPPSSLSFFLFSLPSPLLAASCQRRPGRVFRVSFSLFTSPSFLRVLALSDDPQHDGNHRHVGQQVDVEGREVADLRGGPGVDGHD